MHAGLSQVNGILQGSSKNIATPEFYLYYSFAGLGSNMGKFEPVITIKGTNLVYTYQQNSFYTKRNDRIDTICIKKIRQSSVDSILDLIKNIKDSTIHKTNFCIMSGGIHFMGVTDGRDTTHFQMHNTFDHTALKIVKILNQYLTADEEIWASEQMITDAEECEKMLFSPAIKKKPVHNRKKKH